MNSVWPIRISSLPLLVQCPGSLKMQASVSPLPDTDEIAEGHAGHYVARWTAAGYGDRLPEGTSFECNGRKWEVTNEMAVGAAIYARACGGSNPALMLEESLPATMIHGQCGGTLDAGRFYLDAREAFPDIRDVPACIPALQFNAGAVKLIHIIDYKFGHRFVEVFENEQTTGYVAALMQRFDLDDNDENLYIRMTIVQPRTWHKDGPVRSWTCQARDIRATLNTARSAAREALEENPRCITNPHCGDCKARHVCKTLKYATGNYVDFSGQAEVVDLPPDAVGQELRLVEDTIKRLEARQTGLAAQAEAMLRSGQQVAFYEMSPTRSRLVFKDDVTIEEIESAGDIFGMDLRRPRTVKTAVVTPTQAIDMGLDPRALESYSHRPPSGTVLKRIDSLTARKVFSK